MKIVLRKYKRQSLVYGERPQQRQDKNRIHFILSRRGQSVMEYAVFIIVLFFALFAMRGYLKRAVQGSIRSSADSIGSQYEPTKTSSLMTTTSISDTTSVVTVSEVGEKLLTNTTVTTNLDEQTRTGTETVGAF